MSEPFDLRPPAYRHRLGVLRRRRHVVAAASAWAAAMLAPLGVCTYCSLEINALHADDAREIGASAIAIEAEVAELRRDTAELRRVIDERDASNPHPDAAALLAVLLAAAAERATLAELILEPARGPDADPTVPAAVRLLGVAADAGPVAELAADLASMRPLATARVERLARTPDGAISFEIRAALVADAPKPNPQADPDAETLARAAP